MIDEILEDRVYMCKLVNEDFIKKSHLNQIIVNKSGKQIETQIATSENKVKSQVTTSDKMYDINVKNGVKSDYIIISNRKLSWKITRIVILLIRY